MTYRTTIVDARQPMMTSCGYATNQGHRSEKIQSGPNSPRIGGVLSLQQNPYTMTYGSVTDYIGKWSTGGTPVNTGTYGACFGGIYYPAPDQNLLDARELKALARMQDKVRGHDFNAAVFLAEANESVRMIGDTALRLYRSFFLLKRGRFRESLLTLTGRSVTPTQIKSLNRRMSGPRYSTDKAFADNVLAVQYGWRPLLQDMEGAATAFESLVNRPGFETIRFRERWGLDLPGHTVFGNPCGKKTVRGQMIWDVKVQRDLGSGSLLREFGFYSLEQVLWERIPFSFAADWVYPIGLYLSARAFTQSTQGVSTRTIFVRERGLNPQPGGGYVWSGLYGQTYARVQREVGSIANLRIPPPRLKDPFSKEHALNGISLLTSIFRG